jgi:hypothetical protein
MIIKGHGPPSYDLADIKRQLDDILDKAMFGEITPDQARIKSGNAVLTIKEARRLLGLPPGPILWAVAQRGK